MNALSGRERTVFSALAGVLLERPVPQTQEMIARANASLARCSRFMRFFFRFALLAFEWGGVFLTTQTGRFEQFTQLPLRAKRRYARLWMTHKRVLMRQVFLFLKMIVLSSYYDDRTESARVGYAPKWLC